MFEHGGAVAVVSFYLANTRFEGWLAEVTDELDKHLKIKLGKTLEQYKGVPIEYEYDFGDCWEHKISVVGRAAATEVFLCTAGEGHYVAEDVGSVMGWQNLKEAYRTQRPNKEQREQMYWFERQASNADPRGLRNGRDRLFDRDGVNFQLARM